jgi:hypothetical protein
MNNYGIIAEVGKSMVRLLMNNIDKENESLNLSDHHIAISAPGEKSDAKLTIFLYFITEEIYQRNQEMGQLGNHNELEYPSIYLNLFYMITPNTNDSEKDHLLLGKVIQIFNDNPVLKSPFLSDEFSGQEIRFTFISYSIDDINKIWNIVTRAAQYRPSLFYQATPIQINSQRKKIISRITKSTINTGVNIDRTRL